MSETADHLLLIGAPAPEFHAETTEGGPSIARMTARAGG